MTGAWEVVAWWWPGRLNSSRLVADLVIVAAGVMVARVAWKLAPRRGLEAPSGRATGLVVASAALMAVCVVTVVSMSIGDGAAPPLYVPTPLKIAAAVLWVATAMRSRWVSNLAHFPSLSQGPSPSPSLLPPPPLSTPEREGNAPTEAARPGPGGRMLEDVFHNEPWPLDKADALKERTPLFADLEARQCRT